MKNHNIVQEPNDPMKEFEIAVNYSGGTMHRVKARTLEEAKEIAKVESLEMEIDDLEIVDIYTTDPEGREIRD